jgi:hypothetical protein
MFTVKTVAGFEMILADAGKDGDGNQLWRQVKIPGQPGRSWVNSPCAYGCDCGECYSRSPDQEDSHHCIADH